MDAIVVALTHARELVARGDDAGARDALLAALEQAPGDLRVLTDLGTLLFRTGFRSAARTAYAQAAALHPTSALAHANLANAHFDLGDLADARVHYERAIALDPAMSEAHQGLSYVLARLGDDERSRVHRELGFRGRPIVTAPYRGTGEALRVLLLVSAGGGNVFTERLLHDRLAEVTTLVVDFVDPNAPLPPHDLVFNAIGDADRAAAALRAALPIVARSSAPILNHPALVLATTRATIAGRFANLPNAIVPRTRLVPRGDLEGALRDERFPLLLRSPGFHTGEHFVLVDDLAHALEAATSLPGDALYAIEYIDVRAADGGVRKYRAIAVGGELFALHAAVSRDWKVHYFTADMADVPAHRAEDAAFLADPRGRMGEPAWAALTEIVRALGLDFMGVDFGIDAQGRLVLFESNAVMNVLTPDPDERWAYRRAPVARVFDAFADLLVKRSVRVP